MSSYQKDKADLLSRLRKIEGQVRGLQRMVEEEKYCIDVLTQIASVRAATDKVGLIILNDHIRGCVRDAVRKTDDDTQIEELIKTLERFLK